MKDNVAFSHMFLLYHESKCAFHLVAQKPCHYSCPAGSFHLALVTLLLVLLVCAMDWPNGQVYFHYYSLRVFVICMHKSVEGVCVVHVWKMTGRWLSSILFPICFCFFQYINYLMKKVGPDSHHFESVCIPYHLEQVDSLYSLSCHFISVTQMSGVKQGWRHNLYIICN